MCGSNEVLNDDRAILTGSLNRSALDGSVRSFHHPQCLCAFDSTGQILHMELAVSHGAGPKMFCVRMWNCFISQSHTVTHYGALQ